MEQPEPPSIEPDQPPDPKPAAPEGNEDRTLILRDEPGRPLRTPRPVPGLLSRLKTFARKPTALPLTENNVLEFRRSLLDQVEQALRPHRRRRVALAFNSITVHILAEMPDRLQKVLAALDDLSPTFETAVIERLNEARFKLPVGFSTDVIVYTERDADTDFFAEGNVFVDVRLDDGPLYARLDVIKGLAAQTSYVISSDKICTLGRLETVENSRGHITRTNTVAFVNPEVLNPSDEDRIINETVSRIHGKIEFDKESNRFVFRNERGSSRLQRENLPLQTLHPGRMVPLENNDLIYLGTACLQFVQ